MWPRLSCLVHFAAAQRRVRYVWPLVLLSFHPARAGTDTVVGFFAEPVTCFSLLLALPCVAVWARFRRTPGVAWRRTAFCLLVVMSWDVVFFADWLRPPTLAVLASWYVACPELWLPKVGLGLLAGLWYQGERRKGRAAQPAA